MRSCVRKPGLLHPPRGPGLQPCLAHTVHETMKPRGGFPLVPAHLRRSFGQASPATFLEGPLLDPGGIEDCLVVDPSGYHVLANLAPVLELALHVAQVGEDQLLFFLSHGAALLSAALSTRRMRRTDRVVLRLAGVPGLDHKVTAVPVEASAVQDVIIHLCFFQVELLVRGYGQGLGVGSVAARAQACPIAGPPRVWLAGSSVSIHDLHCDVGSDVQLARILVRPGRTSSPWHHQGKGVLRIDRRRPHPRGHGTGQRWSHVSAPGGPQHFGEQDGNFCPGAGCARVPGPERVLRCSDECLNFHYTEESGRTQQVLRSPLHGFTA